ncbi:hypothetical protein C8J57DRAFT_1539551 [Mycena rebaudengoi]|nr:hypothetical protein C8J57DRAFT_1539551 [Mycena rebaudengoi]
MLVLDLLTTVYFFSQSDIVPILGPSLAVSMVLAGPTDFKAFVLDFLWLEFHLLTFEIKNQIVALEEDCLSKPNRPIVSGRLSIEAAQRLYIFVAALAFAYSAYHRIVLCSAIYMIAIYCYNEGGIWVRVLLLGDHDNFWYHGKCLSRTSTIAIVLSGLLHATARHAQDFRDRFGDAFIGRKTLPLMLPPHIARWSLMLLVVAWTAVLIRL